MLDGYLTLDPAELLWSILSATTQRCPPTCTPSTTCPADGPAPRHRVQPPQPEHLPEDQIQQPQCHGDDHVVPLAIADHRWSAGRAEFWNPTGANSPGSSGTTPTSTAARSSSTPAWAHCTKSVAGWNSAHPRHRPASARSTCAVHIELLTQLRHRHPDTTFPVHRRRRRPAPALQLSPRGGRRCLSNRWAAPSRLSGSTAVIGRCVLHPSEQNLWGGHREVALFRPHSTRSSGGHRPYLGPSADTGPATPRWSG